MDPLYLSPGVEFKADRRPVDLRTASARSEALSGFDRLPVSPIYE
jgi:hypothetical protein